ncbi:uncharacterized protein EDB93DRAFT_623349 [Suillus bovinus]|uniref:uncharacterized protein n=1 Tax=Suillus bovinus TaxID=48563 RepID=UPI001B866DC2|nr:uncharacterized protein EDB93DRAFT_623349 [Suillus bovinus]KAG2141755.1 hypothetical protein EDB93DRAFT_623349 [Suillus bovinus]
MTIQSIVESNAMGVCEVATKLTPVNAASQNKPSLLTSCSLLTAMIPGKVIRINDKVTLKLWPRLEGKVLRITPTYSIEVKPMTVSPHYPKFYPDQLVANVQEVVIIKHPFPEANDVVQEDQEDDEHSKDFLIISSDESEECNQNEGVSSSVPLQAYAYIAKVHTSEANDGDGPTTEVGRKRKREE